MADEISKEAPKEASDPEFFTKKVVIIGDLQTKRALWANKVGRLKGALKIGEVEDPEVGPDTIEQLDAVCELFPMPTLVAGGFGAAIGPPAGQPPPPRRLEPEAGHGG